MREAKKLFLNKGSIFHKYMCVCIQNIINRDRGEDGVDDLFYIEDMREIFPELVVYKPEGVRLGASWWPKERSDIRLRVFDSLIFDYEREIAMRKPEPWYTKLLNQIKRLF